MCKSNSGGKIKEIVVLSQIADKLQYLENNVFSKNESLRQEYLNKGFPFAVIFFRNNTIKLEYLF